MNEELREQIAGVIARCESRPFDPESWQVSNAEDVADALLSGPLAPLLAAQAAVKRVEALAEELGRDQEADYRAGIGGAVNKLAVSRRIRAALGGVA